MKRLADVTRLVGIDFGTSTSVVCVKRYKDGEPLGGAFLSSAVTFGDGQGDNKAHTVVRRNADGTYTCGRPAEDAGPETQVFREFKMDLENPDGAKSAQAKALTEEFFKYLYRWYDHQRSNLGEAGDQEKTIVSFPAKWTEETRSFMVEAARKAGFPDVSAMDEPSAALYASLTQNMNDVSAKGLLRAGEPGYMLLVDMGAGTTDLAVCRYTVDAGTSGVIRAEQIKNEIVSTWPESAGAPTFGGREVDRLLEDYLTDYMTSCGLDPAMARQLVCGTASVKPWKETVVSPRLNEGNLVDSCGFLSGYMMLLPKKQPFPSIDRAKLEELLHDKLNDFKSLVTGCLDKASELEPAIAENGVDLVVLTGGHSAWYFTEALLNGTIPGIAHPALKRAQTEKSRVLRLSNPQETVALGLVYSLLPLKTEWETKKEAARYVNEANTTYAYTPHHREVIKRGTDTIKKAEEEKTNNSTEILSQRTQESEDTPYHTACHFAKDWLEIFNRDGAVKLRSDSPEMIRWIPNEFAPFSVVFQEKFLTVSSHEKFDPFSEVFGEKFGTVSSREKSVNVPWDNFINGSLYLFPTSFNLDAKVFHCGDAVGPLAGFLAVLQRKLRGDLLWGSNLFDADKTPYYSRAANISHFIEKYKSMLDDHSFTSAKESIFRTSLGIPASSEILLARIKNAYFNSNFGKVGWAFTAKGIYAHERLSAREYVSWEEFADAKFSFDQFAVSLRGIWFTDWSINTRITGERFSEPIDFLLALRAHVRGLMGMD